MADVIAQVDIDDLAIGSAFLGTGGGGDPYVGSLLCKEAIAHHGAVKLAALEDVPDDADVFVAAAMGAPTVMIEKLYAVEDAHRAVSALEKALGRSADMIISAEIGGLNSVMPVAYAASRGLPLIDADGMGRAFPSIHMINFNVAGVSCTPLAIADEHGNVAIIEAENARKAEELARPLVAAMGASVSLSCYPMTGAEAKRAALPATVSAAIAVGKAIREGDAHPVDRLLTALDGLEGYGSAYRLFDGKVTDISRDTSAGWVFGSCTLAALDGDGGAEIGFQNENISIVVDGELKAIVPDLICIVDRETAMPIPTESLRYGQRVAVIGCGAPGRLRAPEALEFMGPAAFGSEEAFVPIEALNQKEQRS
ncbi:DUF917 domain-containing protein [Parasphingopyxis algicola]|uniref:DUF917 domain-containing protein n=1 Tax=Parasphingopyxis algicola TaxID=2026624 RepID=UPI0015A4265B|nr:DUF917 domain-containing protein [Parasphingopyxis algicola]QLC26475.1 DUF917 domain-containing protein [Parasphingopyxis algicola]